MSDEPVNATTIRLCWEEEDAGTSATWTIRMAAGTAPPSDAVRPLVRRHPRLIAGGVGLCHRVSGLRTDWPYTFSLVAHSRSGKELMRARYTAAARVAGGFVWSRGRSERLPRSTEYAQVRMLAEPRSGRVEAAYVLGTAESGVFVTRRSRAGGWSVPVRLAYLKDSFDSPLVAVNSSGAIVVAWNSYNPDGSTGPVR